ncbi:hypothetical protein roselon_00159 [Roseibacterium elongatum DSM 19469]|uniref:Uncharacterized protein n=1 Tax=Roseicyclus elongatus DSM 19469 TaxID=1294273 RepID=W8S1K8_9RHOB|nr:hypothetical protein [Roseibacterium elongatum]AHM02616.1 hypothetical protein roselon_00159 [Roseibacterium elongatum DSM 19469]
MTPHALSEIGLGPDLRITALGVAPITGFAGLMEEAVILGVRAMHRRTGRSWSARCPCLMVGEHRHLADWLLGSGGDEITFALPDLSFSRIPDGIVAHLTGNLHPEACQTRGHRPAVTVSLYCPMTEAQKSTAASMLRGWPGLVPTP